MMKRSFLMHRFVHGKIQSAERHTPGMIRSRHTHLFCCSSLKDYDEVPVAPAMVADRQVMPLTIKQALRTLNLVSLQMI